MNENMTNESNCKVALEHFGGPSCDSFSLIFFGRYARKKKTQFIIKHGCHRNQVLTTSPAISDCE
jgi:hypothetical protein